MLLIYLSCAWVAGILIGSRLAVSPLALIAVAIPLSLLFFFRRQGKVIVVSSLCLALLLSGAVYFRSTLPVTDPSHLLFYNDRGGVEMRGMVDRDPEAGDNSTHLQISAREVKSAGVWRQVSGRALVFVPRFPGYHYGDVLGMTGKLETPPQLGDFDYRDYLARQDIHSTMSFPRIEVLETGQGFRPLGWIYSLRDRLSRALGQVLPEPQASLAQGLVLGQRSTIPAPLKESFTRSGTAHLLAISGVNLTIMAGILVSLGIWLFGRRYHIYIWLALAIIWLYAVLTGMQPPVLRAAIMVSLFLIAELLGRQRSALTALALAGAVMVALNPQVLWDVSFQLSFLAMAGLVFIFPPIQALGRRAVYAALGEDKPVVSAANFVVDSLGVSLAAVIAVWPLVARYFGIVAWAGPVATFFASLALPGVTIAGLLAGVIGFISLPVAQVAGWVAWLFLSYTLVVVQMFGAVPPLSVDNSPISSALIPAYYSLLGLVLWSTANQTKLADLKARATSLALRLPKKWVIPSLAVIAVLLWVSIAILPDDRLHVSFLDVGQGDAILIQKGNQKVLVDGGPSPQALALALGKRMPFWDRTIEMVVSTHPHADHVAGLVGVMKSYRVEHVLYQPTDYKSAVYDEWLRLLDDTNVRRSPAGAGQHIDLGGGISIEVLNQPSPSTGTDSDVDNGGIVLRLNAGRVSFLLTADVMQEAELDLINHRAVKDSTVLKVAHHGSRSSSSQEFLAVASPQIAVISVGKDNPFGHPADEAMARLKAGLDTGSIWRTDQHGTIEFITDGERLWMKAEK